MSNAQQRIEDKLNAQLKTLRDGRFPGEVVPTARAPADEVVQSARSHCRPRRPRRPQTWCLVGTLFGTLADQGSRSDSSCRGL